MAVSRRNFIRSSAIAGSGLMFAPMQAIDQQKRSAESLLGVHPFIFENPDAVFIMKTEVDVKTNALSIKESGLRFGRSVFGLTDNPDNGVPLTHKIVLKPNLTCRFRWHQDYTIERSMGIVTDSNFTEGMIESLKELNIAGSQIYIREVNCPDDLADGGYTQMADRTGIDLQCINTQFSDLNSDQLQWIDVENGTYFKRIPYLWPVNTNETWLLNISKLKTHAMGMTLCAKNLQGTIAMNYQAHCRKYGLPMDVSEQDVHTNAFDTILSNYNRHVADGIPRWEKPGENGGIWMETWASRCIENNSVTRAGLHVIEGIYGRDGHFMDGPNEGGLANDYMTNYIIFGLDPYYVDIIGHWLGGHEPGNFGLFHMALEQGRISTINPANIPIYQWDTESGAVLKELSEFQRYSLKTYYLARDFNGENEDYWHMVNEPYEYTSGTNTSALSARLPFSLGENYPNPVRVKTHIPYSIKLQGHVSIEVLNEQGGIVDILVNKKEIPGNHMITWNSSKHPTGLYFYRMRFEGLNRAGKMIVIR